MRHEEGMFDGVGRTRLFRQAWIPDAAPAGVVVLVHGLAEHSGRYGELVERLLGHGYAIHAYDHRGHGRSSGRRAAIGRFRFLVDDLSRFVDEVSARHGGARIALLGHSMGGAVALALALQRPERLASLVLSAPAVGADPGVPAWQLTMARMLSVVLPNAGAVKLPADTISRDPEVVRDYERDPLVFRSAIPARTAVELLAAMTSLGEQAGGLRVPVLVLHGSGDRLVPLANAEPVYARLGGPDKSIRRYAGLFHEVFHEPERAQVFADLEDWLAAHR